MKLHPLTASTRKEIRFGNFVSQICRAEPFLYMSPQVLL
jgi:hypothetical protein